MAVTYKAEHGQRLVGTPRPDAAGDLIRTDIWVPTDGREMYLPALYVANTTDTSDTHAEKGTYAHTCTWCRHDQPHSHAAHNNEIATPVRNE